MTIATLVLAFVVFLVGAVCTYSRQIRDSYIYWLVFPSASLAASALWIWGTKTLGDNARIVYYSLAWDLLMVLAYYGYPIAIGEARFGLNQVAAIGLILAGCIWLKMA